MKPVLFVLVVALLISGCSSYSSHSFGCSGNIPKSECSRFIAAQDFERQARAAGFVPKCTEWIEQTVVSDRCEVVYGPKFGGPFYFGSSEDDDDGLYIVEQNPVTNSLGERTGEWEHKICAYKLEKRCKPGAEVLAR